MIEDADRERFERLIAACQNVQAMMIEELGRTRRAIGGIGLLRDNRRPLNLLATQASRLIGMVGLTEEAAAPEKKDQEALAANARQTERRFITVDGENLRPKEEPSAKKPKGQPLRKDS